jgi:hypothetical protein
LQVFGVRKSESGVGLGAKTKEAKLRSGLNYRRKELKVDAFVQGAKENHVGKRWLSPILPPGPDLSDSGKVK